MRAVLGIDAAWTLAQPSGVAAAVERTEGWHLVGVAPSYAQFHSLAARSAELPSRPSGSSPDAAALLAAAGQLCGGPIDLVAIDMPLAHSPIVSRREADNAVSRTYGGRKCGTHTPSATRPGKISDDLKSGFSGCGYQLCTRAITSPGLIEVYPHPALLELTGAPERLRYKCSKIRAYWRSATPRERRENLWHEWQEIIRFLDREIHGVKAAFPDAANVQAGWQLKAYEDALDAIVCVWIAICALKGLAVPFGDADAAIWVPSSGYHNSGVALV